MAILSGQKNSLGAKQLESIVFAAVSSFTHVKLSGFGINFSRYQKCIRYLLTL
jgi:hypothetical protein